MRHSSIVGNHISVRELITAINSAVSSPMRGFSTTGVPRLRSGEALAPPSFRQCDIGLNLCDPMFQGIYHGKRVHVDDLSDVLDRATSSGVSSAIITGTTVEDSRDALTLARRLPPEPALFCTVGVHPSHSSIFQQKEQDEILQSLSELIIDGRMDGKVVAIGECGLDYDRLHFCDKETQKRSFSAQLSLGQHIELPFFLHNRNTNGEFIQMLHDHRNCLRHGGVVHSFDGSLSEMQAIVDLGLYIGVNGCSLKKQENLDVVRQIPLDSLLLETDAPWCGIKATHASEPFVSTLFPSKKKDKFERGVLVKDRAEPCLLVQVLEVVASLKSIRPEELAEVTLENSQRLFFA